MNGRRFVRWHPEELALWLKDGQRPREVLLTDRLPDDAHVVAVQNAPDQPGVLLVFFDSASWERPAARGPNAWKSLELPVKWGRPGDPARALQRCAASFEAEQLYVDHVADCLHCDEFKRCETGAELGVASIRARDMALEELAALKVTA